MPWSDTRWLNLSATTTQNYRPLRSAVPTFEPITVAEAKKQVELPDGYAAHDDLLDSLIQEAREQVEHDTGIVAATGTFTCKLDEWPCDDWLELSIRPVSAVTSITYVDTAGATQTWSSTNYSLSSHSARPRIFLAYGSYWPTTRGHYQDITLTVVAGYASQSVIPEMLKQAVRLQVARMFYDRIGQERGESDSAAYVRAYEMLIRRLQRCSYP